MIVYISSTYKDLESYRKCLYSALCKLLDVHVVAMEDYVATDQRPVDRCLEDVAKCDVYVGIFAWRYGYIPPDYNISITELEYRKAEQTNKIKLIFLLNENAIWENGLKDEPLDQIIKLRNELKKNILSAISNLKMI